ncbi:MAG: IS607 family transposase [bacterium]|nr:IS607 family transposase [bacterium]
MAYINTREAARKLGVHSNTLRNWANGNKIKHIKTPGGQRRYDVDNFLGEQKEAARICYCRVSSYKQKDDLERQVQFMRNRFPEATIVKDIGSGINFKRKGLYAILERAMQGDCIELISAHRDRLCRFGFDLIKWIVEKSGGRIVVLNDNNLSPEAELTQDLLTILHVFSCRMHGLRSYKNKIAKDFADKKSKEDIQKLD